MPFLVVYTNADKQSFTRYSRFFQQKKVVSFQWSVVSYQFSVISKEIFFSLTGNYLTDSIIIFQFSIINSQKKILS